MRRRPHEDDRKQQDRHRRDVARHRDPADQRRKGPRPAADHDVLWRARLQPDGVDDRVIDDRERQDRGGEPADRQPHHHHRSGGQEDAEIARILAPHPSGGERAIGRALHSRIDIGFPPLVERGRSACPQRDAKDRRKAQHRIDRSRRGKQAAQPGKDDQRHHPRLGQREEIPPVGRHGDGGGGLGHRISVIGDRPRPIPGERRKGKRLRYEASRFPGAPKYGRIASPRAELATEPAQPAKRAVGILFPPFCGATGMIRRSPPERRSNASSARWRASARRAET